jgi:hypothetical protein
VLHAYCPEETLLKVIVFVVEDCFMPLKVKRHWHEQLKKKANLIGININLICSLLHPSSVA